MQPTRVLFVCLGNICRSPMAEGLFLDLVARAGLKEWLEVDSAGTSSHHEGELADHRMRATSLGHGIALTTRSRPIEYRDFDRFDYILTMDRSVHRSVLQTRDSKGGGKAQVVLMRDFDPSPDSPDVPDPYYGGADGFEEVYQILLRSNVALLAHVRAQAGL
jgi:protein-tyrosine phosphatase